MSLLAIYRLADSPRETRKKNLAVVARLSHPSTGPQETDSCRNSSDDKKKAKRLPRLRRKELGPEDWRRTQRGRVHLLSDWRGITSQLAGRQKQGALLTDSLCRPPEAEGHYHLRCCSQPPEPLRWRHARCRLQRLETLLVAGPVLGPLDGHWLLHHAVGHSPVCLPVDSSWAHTSGDDIGNRNANNRAAATTT